ncbi:Itaconate transport protein [Colletotrichum sp. SAR11_59]|nr:Itaconate transport protein [Colletotrichum sp. SAR11_59]
MAHNDIPPKGEDTSLPSVVNSAEPPVIPTPSQPQPIDEKAQDETASIDNSSDNTPVDDSPPTQQDDPENLTRQPSGPAYSAFPPSTKRWVAFMAAVACFVPPMSANIYYPVLAPIAEDLHVSVAAVNLTVTSYMILQAISPTLFGDFGDMAGRRPAFLVAFAIYLVANVGLTLQRNYAALIVLRMLQSGGSSGAIALGFAMVLDISMSSERGKYMGIVGAGINVGPTIGPVLGGVLTQYFGWASIFWFCVALIGAWLVPFALFIPETCRNVVGNGSVPAQTWNRPVLDLIRRRRRHREREAAGLERQESVAGQPARKLRFPNPLRAVKIIFERRWRSSWCTTRYWRIARKIGFTIDRRRGDDLSKFPIEKARLQPVYPAVVVGLITLVAYGWVLQLETSVAAPLVPQSVIGLTITGSFSIMNTLIVDLYPEAPATATAANNLVRCLVGAVGTAIIEYMISGMGRGWCFTFIAALCAVTSPMMFLIVRNGPGWRNERRMKEAS